MTAFIPEAQTYPPPKESSSAPLPILAPTARRTHLVHRRRLGRLGAPSAQDDLPRWTLSHAPLENVAKVEVLDLVGLDARLRQDALDGCDTELDGRDLGEHALERSDGSAGLEKSAVRIVGVAGCRGKSVRRRQ